MTQPSTRYHPAREAGIPDTTTEAAATALAERIQAYWHEREHPEVVTWVTRHSMGQGNPVLYAVRSNLVGGLPPG